MSDGPGMLRRSASIVETSPATSVAGRSSVAVGLGVGVKIAVGLGKAVTVGVGVKLGVGVRSPQPTHRQNKRVPNSNRLIANSRGTILPCQTPCVYAPYEAPQRYTEGSLTTPGTVVRIVKDSCYGLNGLSSFLVSPLNHPFE